MKHYLFIFLLLTTMIFAKEASFLNDEEKRYIQQKKQIKICIDPNWMPFEGFDKEGEYVGMSAEYFSHFADFLNVRFTVVKTQSWSQSLQYVKQRKCDILTLVMPTVQRKEFLRFTTPYLQIPLVLATKIDVAFVSDMESLKGKRLAMPKGYAFKEILEDKYPYLEIVEVENIKDGLKKVNQSKVFGYLGTLASIGHNIQKEYVGELKITGKFNEKWDLSVGVRSDDMLLYQSMQKAVLSVSTAQKQKILNNWISITYEKGMDYWLLVKIILFFGSILLVIAFFYSRLRALKNKLLEQKTMFQSFLDMQDNLVVIVKADKITYVNKKFLDFFHVDDIEQFTKRYKSLSGLFLKQPELFFVDNQTQDWIESLKSLPQSKRVVAVVGSDAQSHCFSINFNTLFTDKYILTFTDITATMMEKAQLHDKVIKDTLTGAYNREFFEQKNRLLIQKSKQNSTTFALAMADIDLFKNINDRYGHEAGDRVLQGFVHTIQSSIRADDLLIRWGGEEFILIIQIDSLEILERILNNLKTKIQEHMFDVAQTVTVSIGATLYQDGEKIEKTIKRADEFLYKAKQNGRNRVFVG